jgi:hypothetical protein
MTAGTKREIANPGYDKPDVFPFELVSLEASLRGRIGVLA